MDSRFCPVVLSDLAIAPMQNVQLNKSSRVLTTEDKIQKILKNITINRNVKMATTDPEGNDDDDDNRGITFIARSPRY
jgi:hypothetical protein